MDNLWGQKRERIVENIIEKILRPVPKKGIYGYPVCQDCGRVGSYKGMYGAIGSHRTTQYGSRFSDPTHKHAFNEKRAFCQLCRGRTEPSRLGICEDCQEVFARHAKREDWGRMVSCLIRERPKLEGSLAGGREV